MLRFLRVRREPPLGPDRDLYELTSAALLDMICVYVIWDLIRLTALVPLSRSPRAAFLIVGVKVIFVELVPFLLLRRGLVRPAIWTLSVSAMSLSAGYIVFSSGLRSSAISLEVGMVTAAVVLLGLRGAVVFGLGSITFLVGLSYAEFQNLLPTPLFVESDAVLLANVLTAITLAAIPVGRAISRLRKLGLKHADALQKLDAEHKLLKQSQEQLQAERSHLRTILDSEPECVKLVSPTGICLDMNRSGLAMIEAESVDQVIGCKVSSLIDPEFREAFNALHQRVCEGHTGAMEYSLTGRRGTRRSLETHVAPLRDAHGEIIAAVAVTRDVTQEKRQATALRESEESFRALFANAPFCALLVDPADLRIVGFNQRAHQQLGYTKEEFAVLTLLDLDAALTEEEIRMVGAAARCEAPAEFETRHRCKNGDLIEIAVSTTPLRIQGQTLIYAAFQNITERKLLEADRQQMTERLRELTGHLQSAREEERKHIAREIHDQLGQQLTGLKMQLNFLFRAGQADAADQRAVEEQVEAAIRSVRNIATELRPGVLDSLGLIAAIEWLAHEFEDKHRIACVAQLQEFQCDEATATTVFRVAQEALTNVARHAHATEVRIQLARVEDSLYLEILDNGSGMFASDFSKPGHFGLAGMRERAILAGGTLSLEPALPEGTRLQLTVPVTSRSAFAATATHAPASGR